MFAKFPAPKFSDPKFWAPKGSPFNRYSDLIALLAALMLMLALMSQSPAPAASSVNGRADAAPLCLPTAACAAAHQA